MLQDASVLGKTFTKDALAALADLSLDVEPFLAALARKEVLGVQADPRSPEHGQYGFLQDLVRHVAYETLSKRERRVRHLAAAENLSKAFAGEEDEVAEVIAAHYVAAYESGPEAEEADGIRLKAHAMLVRAGQRAESLAAAAEARRYFERAADLAGDRSERATLLARAGDMATRAAQPDDARRLLLESIDLLEEEGDTHAAARVSSRLARLERFTGRQEEGLARMERAFDVISGDEPDEDLALLAARLGLAYWASGDLERATERAELALDIAEAHGYMESIAIALQAKAAGAFSRGHLEEALGLVKHRLSIALEHDLPEQATNAYFILSDGAFHRDRYADALAYQDEALALVRKVGDRPSEWSLLAERTVRAVHDGTLGTRLSRSWRTCKRKQARSGGMFSASLSGPLEIHLQRGDTATARHLYGLFSNLEGSTDLQERACYFGATAALHRADDRLEEALATGRRVTETQDTLGMSHQAVEQGLVEHLEAAVALGDRQAARQVLATVEAVPPERRPPFLDAHLYRFHGRLDDDEAALLGRCGALPRDRHPLLARRDAARARGAHGRRGVASRGARDLRGAEGDALAREARRRRGGEPRRSSCVVLGASGGASGPRRTCTGLAVRPLRQRRRRS